MLDAGRFRLDLMATALHVRVRHVAACPEISPPLCAEQDLEPHRHDQKIAWGRLHPGLAVGLGKGWQVEGTLPFDVRVLSIDYTTLSGEPYVPPYGDIHHRDEVLWGFVDGRVQGWRYARIGRWVVGAGLGSTVPLGHTEEDPYARGELGLEHQHFQLGSGTFDPVGGAQVVVSGERWGAWGSADVRAPLYQNRRDYRPPTMLSVSVGPTLRLSPELQLLATAEGVVESAERWNGVPYGGRAAAIGGLSVIAPISKAVVLQAQARYTVWEQAGEHEEEPMRQGLVGTAGVSWTPPSAR